MASSKNIRVEATLVDDKKPAKGGKFKGQKRTNKLVLRQVSKGGFTVTADDFSERSMYVFEKLQRGLSKVVINKRNKPGTVWHELMTKFMPAALDYINTGGLPEQEPELELESEQEQSVEEMLQDQRLKAIATELARKGYRIASA